jgi:hypothetical protein
MTYVYEDEIDDYLSQGFSVDQLHVLQYGEQRPQEPEFNKDIWERTMKMNEVRRIVREVLSEAVTFDNNKTFIPLPNVAQRAQEALNAVSSNKLTQSGTNAGSGLSKAKELASKQTQSFDQMRRMKSYFETNQESYSAEKAAGKTINNSGIIQAWELHGGDSGKDWVNQQMNSLNQSNLNTKKNLRKAGGAGENKGMGTFDTKIMSTNNYRINK